MAAHLFASMLPRSAAPTRRQAAGRPGQKLDIKPYQKGEVAMWAFEGSSEGLALKACRPDVGLGRAGLSGGS